MANRRRCLLWLTSLLLALMPALPDAALARPATTVHYVVNSLDDTVPAFDDFCTLREAIMASNTEATDCGQPGADADEITFVVTGTITLTYDLPPVDGPLTISGGSQITIDGAGFWRIFTVNSSKILTLHDLVLSHAFAETEGGAIRSFGTLYVNNTTFLANHANAGGGAIYSYGVADIQSSQFLTNTGSVGGAIYSPGILGLTGSLFQGNNADVATRGGAVWSSGPLTIIGGQFVKNRAGAGGAIYARREIPATSLFISGAVFDGNIALADYPDGNGGGLHIDNLDATIQASMFTKNGGQAGGAIYVGASGVVTLTNSTLHNNSNANGSGLYNVGTAYLAGVTLSANRGSHGGGIDNFGLLFLTNVTLSQNQADYGGGLKNEGGTARLSNVTLSGNSATGTSGGGILNTGASTHLNLTNVIIANSPTGGNCGFQQPPDLSQFNLSSDNTCSFGVGRNNLNLKLGPLGNNGGPTQTHLPLFGSPAIGGGTDDEAPGVDQRGVLRPQGAFYDVGSVEVGPGDKTSRLSLPLILR